MPNYPLPGTSCYSVTSESVQRRNLDALPADAASLVYEMGREDWEWSLHWYLSQWGGMTATITGWCYGSMLVAQWRAPHEGDEMILVTCIFKANDEVKFSTLALSDLMEQAKNA